MSYPPCLILRHGQTEWNVAGKLQGALDSPLTDVGREHARVQGRILAQFDLQDHLWITSPQGRAVATAELAGADPRRLRHDPRLAEITMGTWTGLARADLAQGNPALFETDGLAWYDHAPGGEGLEALAARTRTFLDDLTGPAVLITHGITSRMLRCHLQGLPPEAFEDVGGGQGVVYRVNNRVQTVLTEPT
ncbi:MAG: histidine phosphatase family protein [Pseudomonadota bacterium]